MILILVNLLDTQLMFYLTTMEINWIKFNIGYMRTLGFQNVMNHGTLLFIISQNFYLFK